MEGQYEIEIASILPSLSLRSQTSHCTVTGVVSSCGHGSRGSRVIKCDPLSALPRSTDENLRSRHLFSLKESHRASRLASDCEHRLRSFSVHAKKKKNKTEDTFRSFVSRFALRTMLSRHTEEWQSAIPCHRHSATMVTLTRNSWALTNHV